MNNNKISLYLSFSFTQREHVAPIAGILGHQPSFRDVFFYPDRTGRQSISTDMSRALKDAAAVVFFVDEGFPDTRFQKEELRMVVSLANSSRDERLMVFTVPVLSDDQIPGRDVVQWMSDLDSDLLWLTDKAILSPIWTAQDRRVRARRCAENIFNAIVNALMDTGQAQKVFGHQPCLLYDGLPSTPQLFDYERNIIEYYQRREVDITKLLGGCPSEWPKVKKRKTSHETPLREEDVGRFRDTEATVDAAALTELRASGLGFTFPEAGPRQKLAYATEKQLNVGILVAGGIAPGINAVIDGIVQRHWLYANRSSSEIPPRISGYRNGFHSLLQGGTPSARRAWLVPSREYQNGEWHSAIVTSEHATYGGSMIGTYRADELLDEENRLDLLKKIARRLRADDIDILYLIGGDGSMKAAHAISVYCDNDRDFSDNPLSVVAIPKTMDNDVLWVWQSFGFLSAVERAREFISQIHTEVRSNPRVCVIQLFGSDSGFVVSHAVLATPAGQCQLALIPEVDFTMKDIAEYLRTHIQKAGQRIPAAVIVMAENAIPRDALDFLDRKEIDLSEGQKNAVRSYVQRREKGERLQGQTSDDLRRGGLKIVSRGLTLLLPSHDHTVDWAKLRVFVNEPRHLLRAIDPSTSDVISAQRLGLLAVDQAMAGYHDCMLSQWLTEFVSVPLELVVLGRKRIPPSGIFWTQVMDKTGQSRHLSRSLGEG